MARARRARRRSGGRRVGPGVDELRHHVGAGLRRGQRLCAPRHRSRRRCRRPRRGGGRLPHHGLRECSERPARQGGLGVRRGAPHQPSGRRPGPRDPDAADAGRVRRLARRLRAGPGPRRRGGPPGPRARPARALSQKPVDARPGGHLDRRLGRRAARSRGGDRGGRTHRRPRLHAPDDEHPRLAAHRM